MRFRSKMREKYIVFVRNVFVHALIFDGTIYHLW